MTARHETKYHHKVTVFYVLILGIILSLYSGILYFSLYKTLYDELDRELIKKADSIEKAVNSYFALLNKDDNSLIFVALRIISLTGEYPDSRTVIEAGRRERVIGLERRWGQLYDKLDMSKDFINSFF